MSDTPRTDAELFEDMERAEVVVPAEFSRQLERELHAALLRSMDHGVTALEQSHRGDTAETMVVALKRAIADVFDSAYRQGREDECAGIDRHERPYAEMRDGAIEAAIDAALQDVPPSKGNQ